jgi:gamma-glutamyltranspeptidase/glutathione hydrolase
VEASTLKKAGFALVPLTFAALYAATVSAQQLAAEAPASAQINATRPAVAARHGIVAAGHPIAASAGLQILLKGGNAFDAAVAVGAMEAMAEPEMNGIGGNGFMTVFHKETGKVWSLAMTGAAPLALKPAEMTPESLDTGMKAGIVPGNLGGYLVALDRFGTMSLAEVLAPAIEYAELGYPIDRMLAASIDRGKAKLALYPTTARIFLPGGQPLRAGDLYRNPDYATTLRKLVEAESKAKAAGATRSAAIRAAFDRFYKGDIAQEMARFFKEQGGLLTTKDFAAYEPQWTEPLHTMYREHDVFSNPATSRGGLEVLMQANLVKGVDLQAAGSGSPEALHAIIESIKIAKADVYRYVGDPKFTKIPTDVLLSKGYAQQRRTLMDPAKAIAYPEAGVIEEEPDAGLRRRVRAPPSPRTTTSSSTPPASRSWTSGATRWDARPPSAASSAATSWWAPPACSSTTGCASGPRRRTARASTTWGRGRSRCSTTRPWSC